MRKKEQLLIKVLLKNKLDDYKNIYFKYSNKVVEWGDCSGSFDFVYEPKITPKNNRSTKIAEISFYDVDKVLCEVVLLAYIDKKCLYSVDILKLGDSDFIQLPNDEKDFVKISDINNALNGNQYEQFRIKQNFNFRVSKFKKCLLGFSDKLINYIAEDDNNDEAIIKDPNWQIVVKKAQNVIVTWNKYKEVYKDV